MNNNIYKHMILECPIPYVMVKAENVDGVEYAKILEINEAFEELFNVKKNNIRNKLLKDIFDEKEIESIFNEFKEMNKEKYSQLKYIKVIDSYLNIEIYHNFENEYHIRFVKLSNQNDKLSNSLRKSPFIAWIKDIEGKYIDINDKYLQLFDVKYEDIIGKSDDELWDTNLASKFKHKDDAVIKKNELIQYKEVLDIKSKNNCTFETSKWPYSDGDTILGSIGISIEVTDKIKLKEIIEQSEQNFLDMANNIDELIVIQDEKKALYISPYFEELYGFKPDALYEDMQNWYKHWDKLEFVGEPVSYDYRGIDCTIFRVVKEGVIDKWIQSKFVPIFDHAGNIIRKIGLLKDITEKKKLEEEMENLRFEFFANISHELRTPINLIMSALQLIYMNLEEDKRGSVNKYLNIINQNSLRLIRLVNNLIDSTKIDSGNFEYNPQNRDIVSFVENISMSVVEFVEKNDLKIIFDTDSEEKIIAFDLNNMERIILNLISNAIKFNKPGGEIEITISTDDNVTISIKDTGIGIPKDKAERIFERFEQVNKHSRREREGSGIGLSLVKSLVEMNNGTIALNSTLYMGSEFIITLPDVVISEEVNGEQTNNCDIRQVNKMEVEFSDIYC